MATETHGAPRPMTAGTGPVATSRRIGAHLAALALFAALAVVMTWPLATDLTHRLLSWGDPVFQAWTMAWDVHAWRTDPARIFDANIFYPYRNTLAYADHLMGQAALVAPVLLATGNAILADNLSVLLALALSGFSMYLLVVDLTGSRLAGVVAGIGYAYLPARMAHLEHLNLLSAQWLPLAVLTARRALRGNALRWAAATGAVVVAQGLFGVYYLMFLVPLLGLLVGTYLLWHPTRASVVATAKLAGAGVVALLLLLPTLWPYQEVHRELGIHRTLPEVAQWSARPSDYLAVHPHNWLYGDLLASRFHRHLEQDLFPGVVLLLLGLLGLGNRRFGWERWMLLSVVLGSVVLSFGAAVELRGRSVPLPYRLAYDLVPGFQAVRVPARLGGLLAPVGLAALAGLGVERLAGALGSVAALGRRGAREAAPLALALLLGAGLLAEGAMAWSLPDPLPANRAEARRAGYDWVAAHPGPIIELPMGEGLIASAWPNFWSTFHWSPVVNGYSSFAPPAYYPLRDLMREFPSPATIRVLQGLGVRAVLYYADPATPREAEPLLRRIGAFPALRLELAAPPDYVITVAPDPWLWDLAWAVPPGAGVDLPALEADPVAFGLLGAILQRGGHAVYGRGAVDYWAPPAAPAGTCYAVLPDGWAVAAAGYPGATPVVSRGGLTLYRAAGCAG
ncbi:MAG: hypothetical protein QJR03_02900 [Sphaerobacter sp.]|nr:hypothetical protein [Sphaerobacter sp.]